ncbi:hypothetical protein [Mycobacterium branderi]|uniref:Integral membrane protein n=1 Tax=Mycobacterium branderi TaxID=43348 RepID=A0A7I7WAC5_9MYCO|nr:hypothetical protein [Mycobacterium branderi]MCV7231159.1 hypothetical protein [Mycobacterium branderi]ORA35729.1 hypothetical protein BST20_16800 [Mycobacterium branderi]BBZ12778.1 hypothetical protein MBRA_29730 [Mycobacterium branderi]
MSTLQQAQPRTRQFARVIGPFLVLVIATTVARTSDMRTLLSEFGANSVWPWVTGAFILLSGLVVVALHQYWRGAAAIIVSALGWLTVLKGLFLMAFPQTYVSLADSALDATSWWWAGFAIMGLIGLYLTYVGWVPAPSRPTSQTTRSTPDVPRAA